MIGTSETNDISVRIRMKLPENKATANWDNELLSHSFEKDANITQETTSCWLIHIL